MEFDMSQPTEEELEENRKKNEEKEAKGNKGNKGAKETKGATNTSPKSGNNKPKGRNNTPTENIVKLPTSTTNNHEVIRPTTPTRPKSGANNKSTPKPKSSEFKTQVPSNTRHELSTSPLQTGTSTMMNTEVTTVTVDKKITRYPTHKL